MFDVTAYQNPYLKTGSTQMQTIVSVTVSDDGNSSGPVPLALAIIIDRSGSMEGRKLEDAKNAAIQVIQLADPTTAFMVVTFNETATTIVAPTAATPEGKQAAIQKVRGVYANGGTCMSTGLAVVADQMAKATGRARKVLFLTDGKNEGEKRNMLDRSVERVKHSDTEVMAWGVGVDWDEDELRYIAEQTKGEAQIIPNSTDIAREFTEAFSQMQKTAASDVRLSLWTPVGVTVKNIQQVFPNILSLSGTSDPANPRVSTYKLGALGRGDQRDYLVDLELPSRDPGQQFLVGRPSIIYNTPGTGDVEEKAEKKGWVFAQWTDNETEALQIDAHVAHYTNQGKLKEFIEEGRRAMAAGDNERATRLLGQALDVSVATKNENMTKMLNKLVVKEANGTTRLNKNASEVDAKSLGVNSGKTSRLK